jgi:hypothetical protein
MAPNIEIDVSNGSVKILEPGLVIRRGMSQLSAQSMLVEFLNGEIDHGNGYTWTYLHGLTFGTMPCGISLGFHEGALTQLFLSVALPGAKLEDGWPTLEAIHDEIAFVRKIFRSQLNRRFRDKPEDFKWGSVWSSYDPKGFMAISGIRYR